MAEEKSINTTSKKVAAKKVAAKKVSTKKAAPKKTVASKAVGKQAARKVIVKKGGAGKETAARKPAVRKVSPAVSNKERYEMIATMAYYRAEKRGFKPGAELADWLECEGIVDKMLSRK